MEVKNRNLDGVEINLGDTAQCEITGFKGTVVAVCQYLNGCVQFLIEPPVDKDGKVMNSFWVDVQKVKKLRNKNFYETKKEKIKRVGGANIRHSKSNGRM